MEDRFKYRVWDQDKKLMSDVCVLTWIGIGGARGAYTLDHIELFEESHARPFVNMILRQCTGLKDKNGKLIYEGDVLHRESFTDWVVYWKKSGWHIYNTTNPTNYGTLEQDCLESREIIGNIYENSELIKE